MEKHKILYLIAILALFSACTQPMQETRPIRKNVMESVFASGLLEADNTYNVTAQSDGYLVEVNFKEGDIIPKGKILAIIENKENVLNAESAEELYNIAVRNAQTNAPSLLQAQTSVTIAEQKMEQDRLQEQRYKRLLEQNSIARTEYETTLLNYQTAKNNYEAAVQYYKKLQQDAQQQTVSNKAQKQINQTVLGKNAIQAAVGGKVYEKFKQTGDYVKRGDIIASIGNPDFIYAKVNVDESSISRVRVGQSAIVQLNTQKAKNYPAVVWEILPSFDEAQQSFVCKLKFTAALDFSIVRTQLQANITVGEQENAILIPRNYLDYGGFVRVKDQPKKVKVETNFVSTEWVQILSGIDENVIITTTNIK
jgi:HlyD family secretion protein